MSDSISGVIIPLIIPVDAPPSLASGVQALAASLETTEFSNACLQLQQSFCYLTWHFADYSARHLQHLGLESTGCSAFGHSRLDQHLQALQENLERLAEAAEKHPEVGDVFRVFYVGGLRARHSSPRRHTRLLGLGGQSIRGYRSVLEWCSLELGDEEFSGELRCQRELRRYLPILREWLDSSSGHFRQIKTYAWFDQTSTAPTEEGESPAHPPPAATTPSEALASLKSPSNEAPAVVALTTFPTPPLLARHQALFEEQAAAQDSAAFVTLGRLAGLAVQYLFAISGAALRSIGQLDPALEKRLETGLTLRQKQTSLTFLFKGLAQHRNENPMLEQVARAVQAPTGGKLADFLTNTWGGGHTFAEFCMETSKPEPPPLWQERFLPGIRAWLQQSASWFAHAEHYFQPPNEQGFVSFTLQLGDEHLEVDRKALQLDTAALRIGADELRQLLAPARGEASGENIPAVAEPVKAKPPKVEPAQTEPAKVQAAKAKPAKAEPAKAEPTKTETAEAELAKAKPAKGEPAKAQPAEAEIAEAEPARAESVTTETAEAKPAKAEPAEVEPAKAQPAEAEITEAEPARAEPAESEPAKAQPAEAEITEAEPARAEPAESEPAKAQPAEAEITEAEPAKAEPAESEPSRAEPPKAETTEAEPAKAEPAESEPAKAQPAEAEITEAEPAKAESITMETAEAKPAKAEPAEVEPAKAQPAKAEITEAEPAVAEVTVQHVVGEPLTASAQDWEGPALALELWDKSIESQQVKPLLTLVSFLIQYTSGVTAEWRELEDKAAPTSIGSALDQLLDRLKTTDDTPVLTPLGADTDPQSLHHWLRGSELKAWLTRQRENRPEMLRQTGAWLAALQPFFKDSEQLFEDPTEGGKLEGVVVYQERFLEFVDHPIYVGPISGEFWDSPP
ncbi:MAG: hypothetical protein KIS61_34060, partial [Candidatus Eremiobacteraeota bacterium]|nr:hypothetical protein [Candidatus Eremiobacteraeota bacterium]